MNLKALISAIEKRPQMYNLYDINALAIFLTAFLYGKNVSNNLCIEEQAFQNDFDHWIAKFYDAPLNRRWSTTLIYYEVSEDAAFKKFFDLYKRWYESSGFDK